MEIESSSSINELREFYPVINDYFNGNGRENISWKDIVFFISTHRKDFTTSVPKSILFRDFFIQILKNYDCENLTIVTAITDLISAGLLKTKYFSPYNRLPYEEIVNVILSRMHHRIKSSIYGDQDAVQVICALRWGNCDLMQVLTTYGFNGCLSCDSSFQLNIGQEIIHHFL